MKRVGITRDELADRIKVIYEKKAENKPLSKSEKRIEAHHCTAKECRCKS